jgi:hypothetical protein
MMEFRKDLFADERDDNLNEIGKPTVRQDILGHVTGRSPYFDDHRFDGLLHLKCLRSPHHHARIRSISTSEAERSPGVRRIITGRDVRGEPQHAAQPAQLRQGRRAGARHRDRALQGRADRRRRRRLEREAFEAIEKIRVDYEVLPHVLEVEDAMAEGAPAINPSLPQQPVRVPRQVRPPEAALRRRRVRARARRPRRRGPLPDVAHRARPHRDRRRHRGARNQRPLRLLHLDPGAVLLPRHRRQAPRRASEPAALHRRHRRRRLRRQGRLAARTAGHPRLHAHRQARALPLRPARGDAVRPAARRRNLASDRRRDERRAHRCPQVHRLFRCRRLHPPVELRRGQERRPPARALHHPQRLGRRLLRLHQPHAGHRHARLRHHRRRLLHRVPHGQGRPCRRHGPAGTAHPQRLPRRRHEGPPPRGQELRPDRVRAGRGGKGQVADPRRVQEDVVADRRRRRPRRHPAHRDRRERPHRPAPPVRPDPAPAAPCPGTNQCTRAGTARAAAASRAAAFTTITATGPPATGANRFSSIFGTRRR